MPECKVTELSQWLLTDSELGDAWLETYADQGNFANERGAARAQLRKVVEGIDRLCSDNFTHSCDPKYHGKGKSIYADIWQQLLKEAGLEE